MFNNQIIFELACAIWLSVAVVLPPDTIPCCKLSILVSSIASFSNAVIIFRLSALIWLLGISIPTFCKFSIVSTKIFLPLVVGFNISSLFLISLEFQMKSPPRASFLAFMMFKLNNIVFAICLSSSLSHTLSPNGSFLLGFQ